MDTPDATPQHPSLETRVSRLEDGMGDLKVMLARIDTILPTLATGAQLAELRGRIDAVVPTLATAAQVSELRGRMDTLIPTLATSAELSEVRGMMRNLPTAWQMVTAIVAGQCTLAALLAAIVFGVLRATGRG